MNRICIVTGGCTDPVTGRKKLIVSPGRTDSADAYALSGG